MWAKQWLRGGRQFIIVLFCITSGITYLKQQTFSQMPMLQLFFDICILVHR
jgi:hypothetical protein